MENPIKMDDLGVPLFRKHPYVDPTYLPQIWPEKDPDGIHICLRKVLSQDLEFAKNRAIDKLCLGRYGSLHHHVLQKGRSSAKHIQGIRRNNRVQRHSTH